MILAPIVLFVYNRINHTQQVVKALQNNTLAEQSNLIIYSDGPQKTEDKIKVEEIRNYLQSITGFKTIQIIRREENEGLAKSIIDGVTETIKKYGKVIVLEDDIVTSPGFITFMNDALNIYQEENKVMHISGYMYPLKKNKLPDTFFYPAASCWGWATWERAWDLLETDAKMLYQKLQEAKLMDTLNINTIHGFEQQLIDNINSKLNTWFIKWHATVVLNRGYCLYPKQSMVQNIGFDNTGEHCGTTNMFYNNKLATKITVKKRDLEYNQEAVHALKQFNMPITQKPSLIKRLLKKIVLTSIPDLSDLLYSERSINIRNKTQLLNDADIHFISQQSINNRIGEKVKLYTPFHIYNSVIGDYSYIAQNSYISFTTIGKFCSIGPNVLCGWGIHPTDGISTSPYFYSTRKQIGETLSQTDKIQERKPIIIGNDVFIGANVTILDGVTIGDGAIIGAGAVVSKDIEPYAIAIGSPIRIIRKRFDDETIRKLIQIQWWNFGSDNLKDIEKMFFEVDKFIAKYNSEE